MPYVRQAFGFATYARQTLVVAWTSFRVIAKRRGGLVLLMVIAALAVVVLPQNMENLGTPLLPRTEYVLTFLTASLTKPFTPWVILPLLVLLWAGELVWREREAGLGEITDAAPASLGCAAPADLPRSLPRASGRHAGLPPLPAPRPLRGEHLLGA